MMSRLTRFHTPVETRSVDTTKLTVDVVASTFDLDSYETRFVQDGFVLERFLKNPVITWAHDDRGMTASAGLPIANAIEGTVRVEDGKLQMRLRFTPEEDNPFGYRVFRLIANGFLHGLSIGFDPVEWRDVDESDEEGNVKRVRIFTKVELQEVAVVTIPSNSNTLVKRAKQLNKEEQLEDIRSLVEDIERMADEATYDAKDVEKWRSYFEKKQPVNREASRVLKAFFQTRGEKQPEDELEAWKRMQELMEEPEEIEQETVEEVETEVEEPYVNEDGEGVPTEVEAEEPKEEPVEEEPDQPPNQVQEAPEPERKASVQIPLRDLRDLPTRFITEFEAAADEALKRGVGTRTLGALAKDLAKRQLQAR